MFIETEKDNKTKIDFDLKNAELFEVQNYSFEFKKEHLCAGLRLSSTKMECIANLKSKITGSDHYPNTFVSKSEMGAEDLPVLDYKRIRNLG